MQGKQLCGPGIGRRGTVAILTAMTAPALAMSIALGIEVSSWTVLKQRLQRAADTAAVAAAASYLTGANAKTAATYGAYIAELNNVKGASTRTWVSSSSTGGTLSDNNISIVAGSGFGMIQASDMTFAVTVQSPAPTSFVSFAFPSGITKTISTTATAEISVGAGTGGQPCILTLQDYNSGTTVGYGITVTGTSIVTGSGCSIRSDDGIQLTGSSQIKANTVYASGAIALGGTSSITATTTASSQTQIPDPYANVAAVQNGITTAGTCSGGSTVSQTQTTQAISPGCFTSITVGGVGKVTMAAGVYYVTGNISITNSGVLDASAGVTIFSNGTFSASGATTVTLVPPSTGSTAGIAFASNSTGTTSFTASGAVNFTGLLYYPKGPVTVSGAATSGNSNGCGEMIVNSVTFSGSSTLAANCGSYGLIPFSSLPGASIASLVQ